MYHDRTSFDTLLQSLRLSDATHSGKAVERVGKSRGKRLLLASLPFPTVSPSWQGLLLALRQGMPRESRALRMKKTFSHAVCVPFFIWFFCAKNQPIHRAYSEKYGGSRTHDHATRKSVGIRFGISSRTAVTQTPARSILASIFYHEIQCFSRKKSCELLFECAAELFF